MFTISVVVDVTRCGNDSFVFNNDCYVIMKYDFTRKESWSGCRMIGGKLADLKGQESVIATTNYLNLRAASLQHDIWVNSLLQVEKNQVKFCAAFLRKILRSASFFF